MTAILRNSSVDYLDFDLFCARCLLPDQRCVLGCFNDGQYGEVRGQKLSCKNRIHSKIRPQAQRPFSRTGRRAAQIFDPCIEVLSRAIRKILWMGFSLQCNLKALK
jgi:hypothetical protein